MPELEELVKIEITKPLPETGAVDITYKIEGSAKMFDAVGAPPWVYAEVRRKEWWKPEIVEEVSYERGFPIPITGSFSIDFRPAKDGNYEVTVVATPAPLSLPVIGVQPVVGKSDMMKIDVAKPLATDIKNITISVIGLAFPATDLKNIAIIVGGPAYPVTALKNIAIGVIGPEYPATDLKSIAIRVIGPEFPVTDIKNIAIIVKGPEFPTTDLKNIIIGVIGVEFPSTDIKNIEIGVAPLAAYTLAVIIEPFGAGYVTISPKKATYSAGEKVTLTAYPHAGYVFHHWRGWDSDPNTMNPITVSMDRNRWAVAAFGR